MLSNKLEQLQKLLNAHHVKAYIQPMHDEFLSEYPPACFKRIEWFCGFSGSAGTLVITDKSAALFVDGRYTLQAANEVDGSLISIFNSGDKTPQEWLAETLSSTSVAYDATLFTPAMAKRYQDALNKSDIALKATPNLIDAIWTDRPAMPATTVFLHEETLAGRSAYDKCTHIAATITNQKADALLISAPENVCWLLNIRAHDTECTPLVLARAILYANGNVDLFVAPSRLPPLPSFIRAFAPEAFAAQLTALSGGTLLADDSQTPLALYESCRQAGINTKHISDPCALPKATKNKTQLDAIRRAHITDGVAVTKLLHWLSTHPRIDSVSEMDIDQKLLAFRAQHESFVEPSFPTIAGSGSNGAIVHYRANDRTNRHLKTGELLLIDSGGQYPEGTTDITRTITIGTPTAEQKRHFTLVLKGHIALATARFPRGTRGAQLDALARQFLWGEGLDYDHGTGHGVGQFLGVHEGPQGISKRANTTDLQPGMILSNEPGYYKEGAYGIRIENLVVVVEKENGSLGFETITCAPLDMNLVDMSLLTDTERTWLADYHAWVKETLTPLLPKEVAQWLDA